MRKLLVLFLISLAVPATAVSRTPPQPPVDNGTLSIRDGRGIVQLSARGSMTGRLNGRLTVTDPKPYDSRRAVVYGARKTIYRSEKTTIYQGRNVRFRLIGALYQVKLDGKAIFMSAIGRGKGMVDGAGNIEADIFYDGVWSLNEEPYCSLPDDATTFELAAEPTD
jgi:hypothetical protein